MVAERCGDAAATADDTVTAAGGTEGENALQSLCWGSLAIGGLTSSALGIVIASRAPTSVIFLITANCPGLILIGLIFLRERPTNERRSDDSSFSESKRGSAASVRHQIATLFKALQIPSIWRPLTFFFLQKALVPSCHQAMMFFSTDVLQFSPEFMAGQHVVAFLCLLFGSAVYAQYVQARLMIMMLGCV